jgi:hypothetical protein
MTTYSFVQYDVLNDLVYFKGTPTPGLVDTINENQYDTTSIRGIINNNNLLEPLPTDAAQDIIDFLETVSEISLADSKYVTLTIAIIDDTSIGNVTVVSKNLNGTKTYATKGGAALEIIIDILKPGKKWPTMGKCRNCLKFTFDEDNDFNFTGNIGGAWDGTYKNGQKVYYANIPTFPNTPTPPTYTDYRIFWKPNVTYSGLDYNGNTINIVNTHKWICVPSSSIGTPSELSNTTFFHVLNNFSASCPYADPTTTWYNFFGKNGFFRLENTPLPSIQTDTQQNQKCPQFIPTQYSITDWGYNCSATNCCVAAPSGSIATYATFAECSASCLCGPPPPPPTSSFGYNCVNGDCVPGTVTYPGIYNTLAQCQTNCSYGYNCINGNCIPGTALATGSYSTLEQCQFSCTASYGYNCTPNGCVQGNALNTGSFATIEECIKGCPQEPVIEITSCSCDQNTNLVTNGNFANGSTGWNFYPQTYTPGVGIVTIDPIFGSVGAGTSNQLSISNTSSVYLSQANIFNVSCSYDVCFQAWAYASPAANIGDATIAISNGTLPIPNTNLINGLTQTPTAYAITLTNVSTTDLTFYFGIPSGSNTNAEIFIDNICVTLIECPQTFEDCIITGSVYNYEEVEYDCLCPTGYVSNGSGSCIYTGSITVSVMPISLPTSSYQSFPPNYISPGFWNNIGHSLLQPPPNNGYLALTNGSQIPPNAYNGQPSLYYQYNLDGTGNSSTGNPSPIAGNPNIHKTQYTFDILKASFWTSPPASYNPIPFPTLSPLGSTYAPPNPLPSWPWDRWIQKRLRRISNVQVPSIAWFGCGTAIPISPVTKTYYLLVASAREYIVKLNGTPIVSTATSTNPNLIYNSALYPAYEQQKFARWSSPPNGGPNTFPSPIFGYNPYITNVISGSWAYINDGGNWQCCAGFLPFPALGTGEGQWMNMQGQPFIYPITIPSGSCGIINVEAKSGATCASGWLGAVLFDNTAADIANATSINQLNILWDTSILPDLSTLPNSNTLFSNLVSQSVFLYGYSSTKPPSPASYIPVCPSGSTPISGSACYGCETNSPFTLPAPCGQCIECTHGRLYNGHVVDKGGYQLQGRGSGGIVKTNLTANNTWVIPAESDWNTLITYLNNGTTPPTTIGSLGTVAGGKMKDYTRDLNATCWENTNIGAQTNVSSSGWVGTAGGKRDNNGAFSGLGFEGIWWSSNSSSAFPNPFQLYTRELKNYSDDVYRNIHTKNYGFSLRLVRPAAANEVDGTVIASAYAGNDGTLYDGIVIGTQVWINKNLSETLYNNGSAISTTINSTAWSTSSISPVQPTSCFYDNSPSNASILTGNVNPLTGECFTFPTYYTYQKCGTSQYLVQTISGNTTTPGKVQKASDGTCWTFINTSTGFPNYANQTSYIGNYFSGSNYVYDDCAECNATQTIYMKFGTKNC